jgi:hypothetical protein
MLSGYEPALGTAATISVLAALAALGMSRVRRTPDADADPALVEEPAAA